MSKIDFREFLKEKRAWYKTIKSVFCPCLQENIIFNSQGFYHLRYDSHGKMRTIKEQMYKIGLLPLVIPVIKSAQKIYHYEQRYSKVHEKYIEFWALKEVVGQQNAKVKVILRKVGDGNITFCSVMKQKDKQKTR